MRTSGGSRISLGGSDNRKGGRQCIIWPNFAKNCMKMKKIGQRWGTRPKFYYADPPVRTVIDMIPTYAEVFQVRTMDLNLLRLVDVFDLFTDFSYLSVVVPNGCGTDNDD